MLAVKTFQNNRDLLNFIQGTQVAGGTAGTNTAVSANLQDLTLNAFADVLVDDQFVISGDPAIYTVLTVTDANNIVLDSTIPDEHGTAPDAIWRALRGGVGEAALKLGSPHPDTLGQAHWIVFYAAPTFKV